MVDHCDRFFTDKTRNPYSNRKIAKYSPIYNKIAKECFPKSPREECKEWREYPTVNPISSKTITKEGKIYKNLQKECLQFPPARPPPSRPSRKSPITKQNSKGKSPVSPSRKSPSAKQNSKGKSPLSRPSRKSPVAKRNSKGKSPGSPSKTKSRKMIPIEQRVDTDIHHENSYKGVVKLLNDGVDVNSRNERGDTPLLSLARRGNGNLRVAELLLDNGADIDAVDERGKTPLMLSANKNLKLFELLLKRGANVNVNPFFLIGHFIDVSQYHLQLLIEYGIDLNATDKETGQTALHLAARYGRRLPIEKLLLENGIDPNIQDKEGNTAMHFIDHDKIKRTIEFLSYGADFYIRNNKGVSPFDKASPQLQKVIIENEIPTTKEPEMS